jgi:hypothetical protein
VSGTRARIRAATTNDSASPKTITLMVAVEPAAISGAASSAPTEKPTLRMERRIAMVRTRLPLPIADATTACVSDGVAVSAIAISAATTVKETTPDTKTNASRHAARHSWTRTSSRRGPSRSPSTPIGTVVANPTAAPTDRPSPTCAAVKPIERTKKIAAPVRNSPVPIESMKVTSASVRPAPRSGMYSRSRSPIKVGVKATPSPHPSRM